MTTLAMLALGNQAWGAPGTYWRAASKLRQNKLQSIMYERLQNEQNIILSVKKS